MTNNDPYIPPGSPGRYDPPGTNPPRHQMSQHDSWRGTTIAGAILVIALLAGGAYMWATNGGHGNNSASNPQEQTTGQGGTRVSPGQDQNLPRQRDTPAKQ
jgi:hypothetical protein